MTTLQFYFDYRSPYSYLAQSQFGSLKSAIGYHVFDLLDVMKQTENVPTSVVCKPKNRYVLKDLQRWAGHYGVPLSRHPEAAKLEGRRLLRATLAAGRLGDAGKAVPIIFNGYWRDASPMASAHDLAALLAPAGFDAAQMEALIDSPEMDQALNQATNAAVERGVFGSPTFFVGDEMFFGNDRFEFVRQALARQN